MPLFLLDSYVSLWLLHAVGAQNKPLYWLFCSRIFKGNEQSCRSDLHLPRLNSLIFLSARLIKYGLATSDLARGPWMVSQV